MSGKWFFDTNVLVYAYDSANPEKQVPEKAGPLTFFLVYYPMVCSRMAL